MASYHFLTYPGFAEYFFCLLFVVPAEAGTHGVFIFWIPASAGMTLLGRSWISYVIEL